MSNKPRKAKKYNPKKSVPAKFRELSKSFYIIGSDCLETEHINVSVEKTWAMYRNYREWVLFAPQRWSFWLAVFCVDQFGKKYVKCETYTPTKKSTSVEINSHVTDRLDDMWNKEQNEAHKVSRVWWATIWDTDFEATEKEMIEYMDHLGAFDREHCNRIFRLQKLTGVER